MSPNYISSNILISQVQSRLCISDTTLHQDVDTTGLFSNENTRMFFNPEIAKTCAKKRHTIGSNLNPRFTGILDLQNDKLSIQLT